MDVRVPTLRADVASYEKSGNDLVLKLKSGDQIVVDNFFHTGPKGEVSRLLFSDGSFSGVTSLSEAVDGAAAGGIGAAMGGVGGMVAAGLAGLGAVLILSSDDGGSSSHATDTTEPTDTT
ncbi:hypothetical protein CG50_09910, partial [Paenirhodobacter enshiensis]